MVVVNIIKIWRSFFKNSEDIYYLQGIQESCIFTTPALWYYWLYRKCPVNRNDCTLRSLTGKICSPTCRNFFVTVEVIYHLYECTFRKQTKSKKIFHNRHGYMWQKGGLTGVREDRTKRKTSTIEMLRIQKEIFIKT